MGSVVNRLLLPGLARHADLGLLALRVVTGAFLLYQCHDNVLSAERMNEFVGFMRQFRFPAPELLAPFAIFWQVAAGIGFILGLLTRFLGLVTFVQFVVAVWMVHWAEGFAGWWPALILAFLGLYFGLRGGGRYGLDALIERRSDARA